MIKDVTIGQYYPADSVIHALDPRTKLKSVLLYIIILFFISGWQGYLIAALFTVSVIIMSKIPVKMVLRAMKPMYFIILFTVILNMLWTPGEVLWEFWIIKITDQGIIKAFSLGFRLILLITSTSMLTYTTTTLALTDAMELLVNKVPLIRKFSHEMSMMMSLALRFIPVLMEEADRIVKAQKSRGADFDSGNFFKRVKAMIPILVPLFVSAIQRALELALAMQSRCYQGGENRTRMKVLVYSRKDRTASAVTLLFALSVLALRYLPAVLRPV